MLEGSGDHLGATQIQDRMREELMAMSLEDAFPLVVGRTRLGARMSGWTFDCDFVRVVLYAARVRALLEPQQHRGARAPVGGRTIADAHGTFMSEGAAPLCLATQDAWQPHRGPQEQQVL